MGVRYVVCFALTVYGFVLLVRVILSYFPRPPEALRPIVQAVYAVTEPVLRLARPLLPPLRIGEIALDLSTILVFILIGIAQRVIC